MTNLITKRMAAAGIIGILSLFVTLHLLILLVIVPFEAVWGGRLKTVSEMRSYELVSIGITLIMISVAAVAGDYLKTNVNRTALRAGMWIMFALFLLNTIGNLLSTSRIEQMVFAPLTLILAGLCLRLARA